ncbi:hypothetical protein ACFWP3_09565, partial [Streptomyces sp. NPDC058525]
MSDQREGRLPERLLGMPEFIQACKEHDFAAVFSLVKSRAGIYPAQIARLCELTPSRVGEITDRKRRLTQLAVIERIADGLRIPGGMLRLAARPWETSQPPAAPRRNDSSNVPTGTSAEQLALDDEARAFRRQLDAARSACQRPFSSALIHFLWSDRGASRCSVREEDLSAEQVESRP